MLCAGEACYLVDASMITAQIAGLYGVIMCIQVPRNLDLMPMWCTPFAENQLLGN